jgi:sulfur transfer protein SufE
MAIERESTKMALSRTKKALSSSTRTARRPEATEGTFRSQIMLNKGLPGFSQKQCHTQPQPVQELVSTVFLVTERPSKPP